MREYYTTDGDVRGSCGHKHRSFEAAESCRVKDGKGCASQGGYTDRSVYVVTEEGREVVNAYDND